MTSTEKFDIPFDELALEPIEGEAADPNAPVKKAVFTANTRSTKKTDRRSDAERREVIRFQDDRRSGTERRPKKSWEPGRNL